MLFSLLPLLACSDDTTQRYFIRLKPKYAEATYEFTDLADEYDIDILHRFSSVEQGFSALPPLTDQGIVVH